MPPLIPILFLVLTWFYSSPSSANTAIVGSNPYTAATDSGVCSLVQAAFAASVAGGNSDASFPSDAVHVYAGVVAYGSHTCGINYTKSSGTGNFSVSISQTDPAACTAGFRALQEVQVGWISPVSSGGTLIKDGQQYVVAAGTSEPPQTVCMDSCVGNIDGEDILHYGTDQSPTNGYHPLFSSAYFINTGSSCGTNYSPPAAPAAVDTGGGGTGGTGGSGDGSSPTVNLGSNTCSHILNQNYGYVSGGPPGSGGVLIAMTPENACVNASDPAACKYAYIAMVAQCESLLNSGISGSGTTGTPTSPWTPGSTAGNDPGDALGLFTSLFGPWRSFSFDTPVVSDSACPPINLNFDLNFPFINSNFSFSNTTFCDLLIKYKAFLQSMFSFIFLLTAIMRVFSA
jgi:hypothetical protein